MPTPHTVPIGCVPLYLSQPIRFWGIALSWPRAADGAVAANAMLRRTSGARLWRLGCLLRGRVFMLHRCLHVPLEEEAKECADPGDRGELADVIP